MKNQVLQHGTVQFTNTTGNAIVSGEVVPLTNRLGIAQTDIAIGATGILVIKNHFEVKKQSGIAFGVDDKVYWDTTLKEADDDNGNRFAGLAVKAAAGLDTVVVIDLNVGAQS